MKVNVPHMIDGRNQRIDRSVTVSGVIVWLIAIGLLYSRLWAPHLPAWGNGDWQRDNSKFHAALAWVAIAMMGGSALFFLTGAYFGNEHRRRVAREKLGQCSHCGYDVRASGERCPECGRAKTSPHVP